MKTKNIILNFSSNTLEIDYDFVYNFYEDTETITSDEFINNERTSSQKSKFIKLNIDLMLLSSNNTLSVSENNTNISNINIDFFNSIGNGNKTLSQENRKLFNTINRIDNHIYFNEDIRDSIYSEKSDIDKSLKYFNIQQKSAFKNFYKNSNVSYYNKNLSSFIEKTKENTKILQNKNLDNIRTYNEVFKIDNFSDNFNTSEINYIPNIEENIFSYSEVSTEKKEEKIFIGILVDKLVKTDSGYNTKSSTFYFTQNHYGRYSKEIIDIGVKYGKTYKYVFYPVYFYSRPTIDEGTSLSNFLLCDIPTITEDISCIENVRPNVVSNIRGKYFENKKCLKLTWSMPFEKQKDIKGFQIFKRTSLEDPYKLVKQLESHSSLDFYERNANISPNEVIAKVGKTFREYYDDTFNPTDITIYSICSIDAHGLVSNYSEQIAFSYDYLSKKTIADLVSTPGAPLFYPNLFVPRKTIFFSNDDKISTITPAASRKTKFTLIVTPDCQKYNTELSGFKNVFSNEYELSIFRLNNRSIYEDKISINYNNQEQ